jgi:hypothetical protein
VRYSSQDSVLVPVPTDELAVLSRNSVISFVQHDSRRRVLSRYSDPVWDLSPYVHTANTARSETLIRWTKVPQGFVPAVKLILYRYWMVGRPGGIRPTAKSVILYMHSFAVHVGVDWALATHQFRRTFAANVANHVLGDLIYLKHHYKHWSIDMTALYALNTQQELELFDEVLQAVREKKIRIIEHWLDDDCMVIGGAATGVKAFKAKYRLETVATRKKLAEDTSDLVNIRATGHGWCLASDAGCGGQGLYEPTRCLDCRNGVIDSSHVPVWRNILVQQRELLVSAADCGPSGSRRIQRDLAHAEKVLGDLGITTAGGKA